MRSFFVVPISRRARRGARRARRRSAPRVVEREARRGVARPRARLAPRRRAREDDARAGGAMGGSSVYFRSTLGASDGARSPSDVAWSPPGALNPLDPACASPIVAVAFDDGAVGVYTGASRRSIDGGRRPRPLVVPPFRRHTAPSVRSSGRVFSSSLVRSSLVARRARLPDPSTPATDRRRPRRGRRAVRRGRRADRRAAVEEEDQAERARRRRRRRRTIEIEIEADVETGSRRVAPLAAAARVRVLPRRPAPVVAPGPPPEQSSRGR